MKTVRIICRYNPFHKGHLYKYNKQKLCQATSGRCYERQLLCKGRVRFCDKWSKGKNGSFAVLVGSRASCGIFFPICRILQGAVKILNKIGVDYISFGVENDNIEDLKSAAQFLWRAAKI